MGNYYRIYMGTCMVVYKLDIYRTYVLFSPDFKFYRELADKEVLEMFM